MKTEVPKDLISGIDRLNAEDAKIETSDEDRALQFTNKGVSLHDYQIPPDLEECRRHAQMSKMERLPMCIHPLELAEYGHGVALYFEMMKELMLLLFFLILNYIIAILCYVYIFDFKVHLKKKIEYLTIRVFGDEDIIPAYSIIVTILMIGFYFAWLTHFKVFRDKTTSLQVTRRTCAHYTVQITGVPTTCDFDERGFIEQVFTQIKNGCELARVNFAFNISQFVELTRALKHVQMKIAKIEKYRKLMSERHQKKYGEPPSDLRIFDKKLFGGCCGVNLDIYAHLKVDEHNLTALLNKCEKESSKYMEHTPLAYATFKNAEDCSNAIRGNREYHGCSSKWWGSSNMAYQGYPIYIERAPEPEDIIWENLHVSKVSQFCRSMVTVSITLFIFISLMCANVFFLTLKNNYIENETLASFVHSFAIPALTLTLNSLKKMIIPILVRFEKPHTKTAQYTAVAYKLAIGIFLNSAIVPLLSSCVVIFDNDYIFGHFLQTIVYNWIAIVFIPPLYELVHLRYLWYLIRTWIIKSRGENNRITQLEANTAFEPPKINFAKKYGENVAIMAYSGFYCIFFPPGIFITLIGFIFRYWLDKWLLLRRYRKPPHIDSTISEFSMNLVGFFIIALLLSQCTFWSVFSSNDISGMEWVYLFTPFVFVLCFHTPFKVLVRFGVIQLDCMPVLKRVLVRDNISELKINQVFGKTPYKITDFQFDYKYFNIITREEAELEYLRYKTHTYEERKYIGVEEIKN